MRIDIIGVKPDREGECYQRGNHIHAEASIKMMYPGGKCIIPLETIDEHIHTSEEAFEKEVAEAIAWLADKTDTEILGVTVVLVPKRTPDALWTDPVTRGQVDEPRRGNSRTPAGVNWQSMDDARCINLVREVKT